MTTLDVRGEYRCVAPDCGYECAIGVTSPQRAQRSLPDACPRCGRALTAVGGDD